MEVCRAWAVLAAWLCCVRVSAFVGRPQSVVLAPMRLSVLRAEVEPTDEPELQDELRRRIEEYLAVYESTPAPALPSTPVADRVYEFIGVASKRKPKKWETRDPLSTSELQRLGYGELIEPIVAAGGWVKVSQQMGLDVQTVVVDNGKPLRGFREEPADMGVTLGSALEDVLASAQSKIPTVEERERRRREENEAAKSVAASSAERALKAPPKEYARAQLSAEDESIIMKEKFALELNQRVYLVLACLTLALAWGHATPQAIDRGLPAAVQELCQAVAPGLVAANVLSVPAAAFLATQADRGAFMWGSKALLAGPTAVLELRQGTTPATSAKEESEEL